MELEEFREKWKAELGENKNSIKGTPLLLLLKQSLVI